jgi:hypothetical protein
MKDGVVRVHIQPRRPKRIVDVNLAGRKFVHVFSPDIETQYRWMNST